MLMAPQNTDEQVNATAIKTKKLKVESWIPGILSELQADL